MGIKGPQGPTGESQGAITLHQSNSSMWREVLDALESNTQPSLQTLRQLRAALFHESQDSEQSVMIAKLLGEIVNGKVAQDESRAWELINVWLEDLSIDIDEITRRAGVAYTPEIEVARETVVDGFEEELPRKLRLPEDADALVRSAARFGETAPSADMSLAREEDENKAHAIALRTDEFNGLQEKIYERTGKWESRYGARVDRYKMEIDRKLSRLVEELNAAERSSDLAHVDDVVDAAKILWNRSIKLERDFFHETKGSGIYNVNLHDYTDYETSDVKDKGDRKTIDPVDRPKREKVGFEGHKGEIIDALRLERRGEMLTTLHPHQWDMLEGIQKDWAEHEAHRDHKWKAGVVVAPTGSGKTHLMGASVELGIRENWLNFNEGSKVVIFTHLKQISKQNLGRMQEMLSPVFKQAYDRDVRITFVGEGSWDTSGDVIIASVPTVNKKHDKFKEDLKGATDVLIMEDEYHHATSAESWKNAVGAVKRSGARGYILGFTATLPLKERPASNIVAEFTIREAMKTGVLPAAELVQVRTGTSLEKIHARYGMFDAAQLSATVRNPERYEHMMKALEFDGVRGAKGGLAPSLIFGVDRRHAHEMAYYYQLYFGKKRDSYKPEDGEEIKDLGTRQIAVLNEMATDDEVERLVTAYVKREEVEHARYDYAKEGGKREFKSIGNVRGKIDGIVAIITGRTPEHVREAILAASKKGHIECIINIRALGEGFDGYWIQNLVGASPMLETDSTKMVQRAQEVGRILRWDRVTEINSKGEMLSKPKPRVIIDLIDSSSEKRPLARYADTLGLGEGRWEYGARIDVKEAVSGKSAYGGIKDIYDVDGNGMPKKRYEGLKPEEMKEVNGERTHHLLPDNRVGEFSKQLRKVFFETYASRVDDMAFDMGVTEEMLVGYLNGVIPNEDRIAKRIGVFLYQGKDRFLEGYAAVVFKWKPLEEMPEYLRSLVMFVREKMTEVYGGRFSQNVIIDGKSLGNLRNSPLHSFVATGKITYSNNKNAKYFWDDLERIVLNVKRGKDGNAVSVEGSEEVKRMIHRVIEEYEIFDATKWKPLSEIPEYLRRLVKYTRDKMIEVYRGRFPEAVAVDEMSPSYLYGHPIHRFISSGELRYSAGKPAKKFWDDLERIVLNVRREKDGNIVSVEKPEFVRKMIHDVIEHYEVSIARNWSSLSDIPEYLRPLVRYARDKIMEMYGGRLLQKPIINGKDVGDLSESPIHGFIAAGNVNYSSTRYAKFWYDLERIVLNVEKLVDGSVVSGIASEEVKKMIHDAIEHHGVVVTKRWKPLHEIPEHLQPLVRLARDKMIEVYGGKFPASIIIDGKSAGRFHDNNPLQRFIASAEIFYSHKAPPSVFWDNVRNVIFGVEKDKDGKYTKAPISNEIVQMIERQLEAALRAWNETPDKWGGKTVPHPLVAESRVKTNSDKGGGGSAPATPATGGAAPAAPVDSGSQASAVIDFEVIDDRIETASTPTIHGLRAVVGSSTVGATLRASQMRYFGAQPIRIQQAVMFNSAKMSTIVK